MLPCHIARVLTAVLGVLVMGGGCARPLFDSPAAAQEAPWSDGRFDAGTSVEGFVPSDGGLEEAFRSDLSWGSVLAPEGEFTSGSLGGRSARDLYVGSQFGRIQHYDGTGWRFVRATSSTPQRVDSLYVSPLGAIFGGGQGELLSCLGSCTDESSFIGRPAGLVRAVCGRGEAPVYAVGQVWSTDGTGVLYRHEPGTTGWTQLSDDTGSLGNRGCHVAEDGTLFIAGKAQILRLEDGTLWPEPLEFPAEWAKVDGVDFELRGIGGAGADLVAVGNYGAVLARDARSESWRFVTLTQNPEEIFRAVAAAGETVWVTGDDARRQTTFLRELHGATWRERTAPPQPLHSLLAVDEHTVVGLALRSGLELQVWKGTRE